MDVELPKPQGKMAKTIEEAARDVAKCLNERNGSGLDLRHVAMLVYHAQRTRPELTEYGAGLLNNYKSAYEEWQDKTEWVQQTATYDELGMHRADALRKRIDQLEEMNKQLREQSEAVDTACAELEAVNEDLNHQINSLELRCCDLEAEVEDAYRQLNYEG